MPSDVLQASPQPRAPQREKKDGKPLRFRLASPPASMIF